MMPDGTPSSIGVVAIRPSRRPTRATADIRGQSEVQDVNARRISELVAANGRLEAANAELTAHLSRIEANIPVAAAILASPPVNYASVAQRDGQLHVKTGFQSAALMEVYLAVLCNCQFDELDKLSIIRNGEISNQRPQNTSRRKLSGRDMFLLYFMYESDATELALAKDFDLSLDVVTNSISTCAHANKIRMGAWGTWPTHEEGLILTPKHWMAKVFCCYWYKLILRFELTPSSTLTNEFISPT
jgi:hypothetical protein